MWKWLIILSLYSGVVMSDTYRKKLADRLAFLEGYARKNKSIPVYNENTSEYGGYYDDKGFLTTGIGSLVSKEKSPEKRQKDIDKWNAVWSKKLGKPINFNTISKEDAEKIFAEHSKKDEKELKEKFLPDFDSYPDYLKIELMQGKYRGEFKDGYTFDDLIREGKFKQASKRFLDNREYRESLRTGSGVHKRMEDIAKALNRYGNEREELNRLRRKQALQDHMPQLVSDLGETIER
tara:strand:- start:514 stop:1221 length:708 start_codon:yes stop_codon:yes gene_type:complete